jgi:Fe-S-cluster-containing hydrogenase component 2
MFYRCLCGLARFLQKRLPNMGMHDTDTASIAGAQTAQRQARYGRLQQGAPLGLHMDACLAMRSRHSDCRACEAICPARVLNVVAGEGPVLGEGCLGCGRCAAACPTGALVVPGFGTRGQAPRGDALAVECWKVPRGASRRDALRVPCLGGLSVSQWLELRAQAREREILLADRGWCARCSAGCREAHPAARTIERVNRLLGEAGVPATLQIRFVSEPLPAGRMPDRIPDADAEQAISRRAFFSSLTGRVSATVNDIVQIVPVEGADSGPDRRSPIRSYERQRTLALVQRIASDWRHPVPRSLFNVVEVSAACRDHGVCAATCPTGALYRYREEVDRSRGLAFDAWRCIGCGHCEKVCPEGAVRMERGAAAGVPAGATPLTRFGIAACGECGASFSVGEGEDENLCPNCRKRRNLAQSAFRQLFSGTRH